MTRDEQRDVSPLWMDNRELIFAIDTDTTGKLDLARRRVDLTTERTIIATTPDSEAPMAISPDGKTVVVTSYAGGTGYLGRFSLENNPQPERDWPLHALNYEDAEHQRISEETAFTLLDFVACDARYAEYFARLPRGRADAEVPSIPMVDADNRLHRVIVGEAIAREARRCLDAWRALQARVAPKPVVEQKPVPPPAAPAPVPAAPEPEKAAPASDAAAYIETPRCTTCEECVKINSRMFVYDANKQAYIADGKAGSYRELVEAAESCQVSIIHPGKPFDPTEPGLAELVERAKPFL